MNSSVLALALAAVATTAACARHAPSISAAPEITLARRQGGSVIALAFHPGGQLSSSDPQAYSRRLQVWAAQAGLSCVLAYPGPTGSSDSGSESPGQVAVTFVAPGLEPLELPGTPTLDTVRIRACLYVPPERRLQYACTREP